MTFHPFAFLLGRRGRRWLALPAAWATALFVLLSATPALAYAPISESHPIESWCNDTRELAGVLMTEGGAQPIDVQIRMAQIIKAEADGRGLSVCALTRLTNFIAVRHYADAHPDSWTARNIDNPPARLIALADAVLRGEYADMRDGAMHFDGDGMRVTFRP